MRINNVFSGRPAYYDRNPTLPNQRFGQNAVAPHGLTTRFTYTVPSARKAFLGALYAHVFRVTAGAPVGLVVCTVTHTNGANIANLVDFAFTDNTLLAQRQVAYGSSDVMVAGDTLVLQTSDGSTGGTVDYRIDSKITEFDA
jgi:hypothetical protein